LQETLLTEEEAVRTVTRGQYYVILPVLPELRTPASGGPFLEGEYTSAGDPLAPAELRELLRQHRMLVEDSDGLAANARDLLA
jgi:hypothetical protein